MSGGGAETQLRLFLEEAQPSEIEICVGTFDENYSSSKHSIITFNKVNSVTSNRAKILNSIESYNPDIVWNIIPAGMKFLPISKVNRKYILVNGMRSSYRLNRLKRVFQWMGFLQSSAITSNVHPEDMHFAFRWLFKKRRGKYIPNAIPDMPKSTSPQRSNGLNILFAGRLIKDKNVDILIEAIHSIKSKVPDIQLLICGEGTEKNNLELLVSKFEVSENIKFLGYRNDLGTVMERCQIFILPSNREGMPNTAFEATTKGLALILSDIKAHKRWFKHKVSAYLFKTNNVDDLAEGISFVMKEENAKKLINEAQKLLPQLSINQMYNSYINLFKELVHERKN